MHNNKREILKYVSAFMLFFFSSIYITFPLLFHISHYSTGFGDELLLAWIHGWVIHALTTNPLSLFNANIYYPYHNSLAFSDVFITGSILTAPFVYFFGQPIVANNITFISSLILLGFSVYLLSYYLIKNYFVSLVSGLLVIFSPATLSNSVQLQMLEIYWVPLALLFFLLFLNTRKTRFFVFYLFCFLLQFYNSFLPAYFILFSSIIILLFVWREKKKKIITFFSAKNVLLFLLTFLLMIPIVIPYFQVSREFHYTRDVRDSIHFALQPEDLLYPDSSTRLYAFLMRTIPTNHYSQNNEFKPGYVGFVFSLLILFAMGISIKNRNKISLYEKSFLTIAILGLLLSFGPFLHLFRQTIHHPFPIPLPYLLFYYIMPGFEGFRNSQRWEMLFIIGMAIFISLILAKLLKKISLNKQLIIYSLLLVGIIVEFSPFTFVHIPQIKDFPKIYSWMNTTSQNTSFIILPIYNWNMPPYAGQELFREYYSTVEFRPMVNGYSGFSPPPWQDFIYTMHNTFPQQKSIAMLHAMGISYIIVDKDSFDTEYSVHTDKYDGNMIIAALKKNRSVSFIKTIDTYAIFSICYSQNVCLINKNRKGLPIE
jgi:hypothetical protein